MVSYIHTSNFIQSWYYFSFAATQQPQQLQILLGRFHNLRVEDLYFYCFCIYIEIVHICIFMIGFSLVFPSYLSVWQFRLYDHTLQHCTHTTSNVIQGTYFYAIEAKTTTKNLFFTKLKYTLVGMCMVYVCVWERFSVLFLFFTYINRTSSYIISKEKSFSI